MTEINMQTDRQNRDWRREYPFTENHFELESGARMHYVDEGPANHPVIMVHGNPTWSFMYRRLITSLSSNGRRAIAVDNLGCGLSDKPRNYPYRLQDHIDNLTWFINSLNLPSLDLVVHDWGGAIGLGYAVRHPEKIRRLVVLNSAAFLAPECPRRILLCRQPLIGPLLVRGLNAFAQAAVRMAVHQPRKLTAAARRGYLAPYNNYRNRIAILRFVQDIPRTSAHPTWKTMRELENGLARLQDKPMLICWGMRDFCFTPRFLELWLNYFPNARVERFTEAGHYLLEDTGPEAEIIINRFLT